MNTRKWLTPSMLLVAILAVQADAQPKPTTAPATQPADVAAIKPGAVPQAKFLKMHESFIQRGKEGPIGVLFLGDSITEGWTKAPEVWEEHYGKMQPANFGIGADKTQHVIWRIEHGEFDGISPKVVVLLIGTNNVPSPGNTADEIAAADKKIVEEVREKCPTTKVLVLGVFPRGADPELPMTAGFRETIKQINAQLAKLDDGKDVRFLDFGEKYLNADGLIRASIMPDALHPTVKGYQIWAEAMDPLLNEMMK